MSNINLIYIETMISQGVYYYFTLVLVSFKEILQII